MKYEALSKANLNASLTIVSDAFEKANTNLPTHFKRSLSQYDTESDFIYIGKDSSTNQPISIGGIVSDIMLKNSFSLVWIGVTKSKQGQGYGTAMVEYLIKKITIRLKGKKGSIFLATGEDKEKFYKKFGFKAQGFMHNNILIMVKIINE